MSKLSKAKHTTKNEILNSFEKIILIVVFTFVSYLLITKWQNVMEGDIVELTIKELLEKIKNDFDTYTIIDTVSAEASSLETDAESVKEIFDYEYFLTEVLERALKAVKNGEGDK